MPTREAALEDLDENLALASGDLELSEETLEGIEVRERERREGRTVSHTELKRELELRRTWSSTPGSRLLAPRGGGRTFDAT